MKIIWSMNHVMREDVRRRFTFGYTMENTQMRLWFASRSDILVSEPFNFIVVSDRPSSLLHAAQIPLSSRTRNRSLISFSHSRMHLKMSSVTTRQSAQQSLEIDSSRTSMTLPYKQLQMKQRSIALSRRFRVWGLKGFEGVELGNGLLRRKPPKGSRVNGSP